jgi:hypothetical protein
MTLAADPRTAMVPVPLGRDLDTQGPGVVRVVSPGADRLPDAWQSKNGIKIMSFICHRILRGTTGHEATRNGLEPNE